MKIVHVINYFQPDLGYEEYYTALNQVKLNNKVYILTSSRKNPSNFRKSKKEYKEFEEINGIKIYRLRTFLSISQNVIFILGLRRKIREINPDIIHLHGSGSFNHLNIAFFKKKLGFKLVVDHHEYTYKNYPSYTNKTLARRAISKLLFYILLRNISNYVFKISDLIIPVSNECFKNLKRYYKFDKRKIFISTLGVDTDFFYFDHDERIEIRRKLGIDSKDLVLISVSSIFCNRTIENIIKLYNLLIRKNKFLNIFIILVGITGRLKSNSLRIKNIIFVGEVKKEDLYKYYSASDIAFYIDKNSIGIFEAMACRLPIIIPKLQWGGIINNNGYTFNLGDINECSEKVNSLVSNYTKRENFAKKSVELVSTLYSYEKITADLLKKYHSIIEL